MPDRRRGNATAVAGGFELLLGCDVVVASEAASFGVPEVKRGLFAAGGGVFISTRIPLAMALELTLTGDLIDAGRAQALGLINQVVPPADVLDAAVALAERIARNGPSALPATKQLVRTASTDLERARGAGRGVAAQGLRQRGCQGRATAFIEKRDRCGRDAEPDSRLGYGLWARLTGGRASESLLGQRHGDPGHDEVVRDCAAPSRGRGRAGCAGCR